MQHPWLNIFAGIGLIAVASSSSLAAIYRCEDAAGKTTYQETPCAEGKGKSVKVEPTQGFDSKLSPAEQKRWNEHQQAEKAARIKASSEKTDKKDASTAPTSGPASEKTQAERENKAGERPFVRPGTPEHELERRLGKPDKVSKVHPEESVPAGKSARGGHSGGSRKKSTETLYVYYPAAKDPQTTTEVYLRQGKVSRVERRVVY